MGKYIENAGNVGNKNISSQTFDENDKKSIKKMQTISNKTELSIFETKSKNNNLKQPEGKPIARRKTVVITSKNLKDIGTLGLSKVIRHEKRKLAKKSNPASYNFLEKMRTELKNSGNPSSEDKELLASINKLMQKTDLSSKDLDFLCKNEKFRKEIFKESGNADLFIPDKEIAIFKKNLKKLGGFEVFEKNYRKQANELYDKCIKTKSKFDKFSSAKKGLDIKKSNSEELAKFNKELEELNKELEEIKKEITEFVSTEGENCKFIVSSQNYERNINPEIQGKTRSLSIGKNKDYNDKFKDKEASKRNGGDHTKAPLDDLSISQINSKFTIWGLETIVNKLLRTADYYKNDLTLAPQKSQTESPQTSPIKKQKRDIDKFNNIVNLTNKYFKDSIKTVFGEEVNTNTETPGSKTIDLKNSKRNINKSQSKLSDDEIRDIKEKIVKKTPPPRPRRPKNIE